MQILPTIFLINKSTICPRTIDSKCFGAGYFVCIILSSHPKDNSCSNKYIITYKKRMVDKNVQETESRSLDTNNDKFSLKRYFST